MRNMLTAFAVLGLFDLSACAGSVAVGQPEPAYTASAPYYYNQPPEYYPSAVANYNQQPYGATYVGWRPTVGYVYLNGPQVGRPVYPRYWNRFTYYYHYHHRYFYDDYGRPYPYRPRGYRYW